MPGILVVPVVTPYLDGGSRVDLEGLEWLLQRLAEAGVDGFFIAGTTGEKELLTVDEIGGMVEVAVRVSGGSVRVFAGTPTSRVSEAVEAARRAGEAGADHVMTTPPLYFNPGPGGILEFYKKLALASGDATIYAYTIPSHVGYNIPLDVVERLASEGVAEGIKATVADSSYIVGLASVKDRVEGFKLLAGLLEVLPLALAHGWDGAVDALSNVAPGIARGILDSWSDGDTKTLTRLSRLAARLSTAARPYGLQSVLKGVLAEMGAPISRAVRQPLAEAPEQAVRSVKNLLCGEARDMLLPGLKC